VNPEGLRHWKKNMTLSTITQGKGKKESPAPSSQDIENTNKRHQGKTHPQKTKKDHEAITEDQT